MRNLRVYIIDDHEIVRSGLRQLLQMDPDLELVGEASSGEEALRSIAAACPDIILTDLKMHGMGGIATIRALREVIPNAKILVLSVLADDYVAKAIDAGASGYLIKDITGAELIRAIHSTAAGMSPIHFSVPMEDLPHLAVNLPSKQDTSLSSRQIEVLSRMAQGASNADIAQELLLGQRTVKREVSEIFRKLGVTSRAEAIACAHKRRLI